MSNQANGHVIAGRYELIEVTGRGGYSLVFRARDRQSGDIVAVKMLSDVAARDPQQVERLRREQQALAQLSGTGAVRMIDLCSSASGKLCLVMEWLDGVDLEERLHQLDTRGERMAPAELVAIVNPLVDTLDRAHAAGILHRDLKPANVFLLSNGEVRLLDFGLARMRRANPLTSAGSIMGSPSYIAPEVWQGNPDALDQRVDVYSLGVIVFVALSGRLPFEGATLQEKFAQTTTAARPSLCALRPGLPADLDAWVEEVLAIDRDGRFSSVRAAGNALVAALGLTPAPAIRPNRIVQIGGETRARVVPGGERSFVSEWLAKSDLRLPAATPSPAPPDRFEAVPAPFSVRTGGDPGERSLVSEWLAKSDLELDRAENLAEVTPWTPPDSEEPPTKPIPHPLPPRKSSAPPPEAEPPAKSTAPPPALPKPAKKPKRAPRKSKAATAPKSKNAKPRRTKAKKGPRPSAKRRKPAPRRR